MNLEKSAPILVISGPSGCGKSSLLKILFAQIQEYYFSISTTTRDPREGETNGVEYFFCSKEEFEKEIQEGSFLEYAKVHSNYYGTSLKPVTKALSENKIVIFDIDVQGHEIIRQKLSPITTSVFITTPNISTLEQRLTNRQSDAMEVIEKRMNNAKIEINSIDSYDFIIINDDLQTAAKELLSVVQVAYLKSSLYNKKNLLESWLNH